MNNLSQTFSGSGERELGRGGRGTVGSRASPACTLHNELALNDNDCVKHCDHQRSVPEDQEGAGGLDTGGGGGSENPGQ